jgi:bacterioferritin
MSKQKLLQGLNQDFNDELSAAIRYLVQASVMKGIAGHEARELFKKEIADEMGHAALLADKIVALGGTPQVKIEAPIPITDGMRALKREYDYERRAVANYAQRCKEADALGEIGLRVELENLIADETRHAEEIARLMVR